jgi:hypothetical protein
VGRICGNFERQRRAGERRLPRLDAASCTSRAGCLALLVSDYLRAAQAYMLISMPTGTSTIFGVFQAISFSQV